MADFNFISFPATQVASADPNALDDYEEGTWVPNQGVGLTVVGAFSSLGSYTKVGRLVTVNFTLTGATSVSVAVAGTALTSNLPFTVTNTVLAASGGVGTLVNAGVAQSGACVPTPNTTTLYGTAMGATVSIYGTITYFTS
jgi:hypothetical protein